MTKSNRILAVIALGAALTPFVCLAQNQPLKTGSQESASSTIPLEDRATKEQLAKLFEVMRLRQQLDSAMKTTQQMVQQQVAAQTRQIVASQPGAGQLSPEEQKKLDMLQQKYMKLALDIYPVDEMIQDISDIYQRHMSRPDVDAFIAFYSSPPGQHLLDEQPVIMREYTPIAMRRVNERTKKLTDEMVKDVAEQVKASTPPAQQK